MKNLLPHVLHLKFNQIDIDTHPTETHSTGRLFILKRQPNDGGGGKRAKAGGTHKNNNNNNTNANNNNGNSNIQI